MKGGETKERVGRNKGKKKADAVLIFPYLFIFKVLKFELHLNQFGFSGLTGPGITIGKPASYIGKF